jgi:hypothetical protein
MRKTVKGKISRTEWPSIVERHRAGEPLASIARSYGCTAPAVRYILTRRLPESGNVPLSAAGGARRSKRSVSRVVLDADLRERINSTIALFLTAFDGVIVDGTDESLGNLLAAADQLLRAGARTRIEVQKLLAKEPERGRAPALETAPATPPSEQP